MKTLLTFILLIITTLISAKDLIFKDNFNSQIGYIIVHYPNNFSWFEMKCSRKTFGSPDYWCHTTPMSFISADPASEVFFINDRILICPILAYGLGQGGLLLELDCTQPIGDE